MPRSLADMIPQDLQVFQELLESTQPWESKALELNRLHFTLKAFYSTYITAQVDLELHSIEASDEISMMSSQYLDQQLLVKNLAQEIPDSFNPLPRAELPAHDE